MDMCVELWVLMMYKIPIIFKRIGKIRIRSHLIKNNIVVIDRGEVKTVICRLSNIGIYYRTNCDGVDDI
jgi:hypothetical protein